MAGSMDGYKPEEGLAPLRQGGVLAVQGSPRRGGNTDRLLDAILREAAEAGAVSQRVNLREMKISPCLELYHCLRDGRCGIADDMTGLYDRLLEARVLVVSSPVFFYGPSAQLKTMIDRCQALWARKYVIKEPSRPRGRGYIISAGATRGSKLFDGLLLTVKYFFDVLDLELAGQLLVRGVDEAGDVDRRPEVMEEARALGREIARSALSGAA